jgi:predicted PurR-regulated permease PerM
MPGAAAPSFLKEIWANKWIKLLALLLGVLLLGWFIVRIRHILTSLAIAWVFAYICDPLVARMTRRRLSRSAAIGALAVAIVVFATAAELVIVPVAAHQLAGLRENLPD